MNVRLLSFSPRSRGSRRLQLRLCLSFVVAWTTQGWAASPAVDCQNVSSQYEVNQCAEIEYKRVDRELNRVYRQLMSRLQPEVQQRLRNEQRHWIKERDAKCQAAFEEEKGGTIAPWMELRCLTDTTTQRINELKVWPSR